MVRSSDEVIARASALKTNLSASARVRWKVRAILDGGPEAIRALLGDGMDTSQDLPWPNLLHTAINRLGQKIGHLPDPRVRPPGGDDTESARRRAEKRQKIVEGYDEGDRMELQLPQVGRWLPGYGFVVWTIETKLDYDGVPYPAARLRDPYDCYPGEWGVTQQPRELAVCRIVPPLEAERMFPAYADEIRKIRFGRNRVNGGVVVGAGSWENQLGRGLEVIEYYDEDGTHILLPALSKRVAFYENPLRSGPAFVVAKRFAFNRLIGQYDHTIGLAASIAKINMMVEIAMQDAVFAPTNIYGDIDGQYEVGRFVVNKFPPGTRVDRPQANLPYQTFEHINRLERQFRIVASYPVTDDSQSPMSFVTGEGLQELGQAVSGEVAEYHKVLRWALRDLDAKRLEWDEAVSPNRRKPIICGEDPDLTPVREQYVPAKDIRGRYRTERIHGMMAGWDESAKIVAGLQMLSAGVIDRQTLRENIHGLTDLLQIDERVRDDRVREALMEAMVFAAQQGDQRAVFGLIAMLSDSKFKRELEEFFGVPEEEEQVVQSQPADPLADLAAQGAPPDITTVLSRLTSAGAAQGGVQTVGRLAG